MSHILHSDPNNPRAFKALIAAKYVGVEITVPEGFTLGVDNKTPEFLAKNPLGKVPVLDTPEGPLFESNAIARYVARLGNHSIYGHDNYTTGLIDQWIDFAVNELELPALAWLLPIYGTIPNNPQATQKAQQDVARVLQILDNHLLTNTYIVGNKVTLADIVLFTALLNLYKLVLDPTFRAPYHNTNRWFVTLAHQPNFAHFVGEVHLAQQMAVAKKEEKKKEVKPPKEEKKKEEKKKEEKPKEEKKKEEKPKKDEDEEEEENYEDEEPKGKNPLDLLPKSNFGLDDWKRKYSNTDPRAESIPWFYANYDKEGYSLFWSDYKFNDELKVAFMTSNLIGGFFQRLEKLHKYGFASVLILGEEGVNLKITGVWVFRGQGIPAEMTACDDYENFNWKPVNLEDAHEKKLFEDYLAWDSTDEFGGKGKFVAGKLYK